MITSSLQIIYDWKQAENVKQMVIKSCSKETQKSPIVFCEWFSEQGSIEWHDASITKWSPRMVEHLNEIKNIHSISEETKTFVIWNAQCMSQNDWYVWKDLKSGIRVIFVSDMFIPLIRVLGYPSYTHPVVDKKFTAIESIMKRFFNSDNKFEWKLIVDFRDEILKFLEWHSSNTVFKRFIANTLMDIAVKRGIKPEGLHMLTSKGLQNLSNASSKIQIVMGCEYAVIFLVKLLVESK